MSKFLFFFIFPWFAICQVDSVHINRLFNDGAFVKAEQELTKYLKKNPEDIEAIELLGDAYGYQKKWDKAMASYQKLIDVNANNANYHYKYGGAIGMKALSVSKIRALGLIGDIKHAFLQAAELDPKHIDARWALVEFYMKLPLFLGGGSSKALKYANELEILSKVDGYLAKGFIYEYENEPELAEKYYKLAITVGGSLVCYDKLTQFYMAQNQPQKAIANLQAAYRKHQDEALLLQINSIRKNNL